MTIEFGALQVRLRFSFFAVLALMLLLREKDVALLCFLSSLLHECGHLLFLSLFHAGVRGVTFGAAGIVIERRGDRLLHFSKEILIALGGVLVNGLLCGLSLLFRRWLPQTTCDVLCAVNLLLAALNLLPVVPLDCARALAAVLEAQFSPEKAAQTLQSVSLVVTLLFAAATGLLTYFLPFNPSLWAVCGYLILLNLGNTKRSTSDV